MCEKEVVNMEKQAVINALREMLGEGKILIFDESTGELHGRVTGISENGPLCIQVAINSRESK